MARPGGAGAAEVELDPFRLSLVDRGGRVLARQMPGGFSYVSEGREHTLQEIVGAEQKEGELAVQVKSPGGVARIRLAWRTPRALEVSFEPPAYAEVSKLCEAYELRPQEAIYGLTERNTDSISFFGGPPLGELIPREVGTLDRRGETVEMFVRPTVGLYAPFYQSSAGYGHYVRGTWPGRYDVGSARDDVLRLCFESGPGPDKMRIVLFLGDAAEILDEYTALTGRPQIPPEWAFRHWRWRDELEVGAPESFDGVEMNAQVAEDLSMYERFDFPAGVYLIDRPWTQGDFGFENFRWDEERLPNAEAMLGVLRDRGWPVALWSAAFAVGENEREAEKRDFLAPGSDLIIDLTNARARDWWKKLHADFAQRFGIAAWKLDRGEESLPSKLDDLWSDGRRGREVHNAYPTLQAELYSDAMRQVRGEDFTVLVRAGYPGTQAHAIAWGGDITGAHLLGIGPGTDLGLRSAIIALQRAGFLGYPFWGSDTGGYYEFKDREVFARWLEFSAFCPLMEIGGKGSHAPWDMPDGEGLDLELIDIYGIYVRLHHDLIPTAVRHAEGPATQGLPLARALVFDWPDDPAVRDLWDEYLYGDDLLVAPIWRSGQREREVYLPSGRWEDFWDPTVRHQGPTTVRVEASLDKIPVFVRAGAVVPGRVAARNARLEAAGNRAGQRGEDVR